MSKILSDEVYLAADSVLSPEIIAFLNTEKSAIQSSQQRVQGQNTQVCLDEYEQAMAA